MPSEEQSVDLVYGFELRGERQVEHGLDGMVKKMLEANGVAGVLGAGFEKVGKILEVGLPVGLAAAGAGMLIDKFSEASEEAEKIKDKMDEIAAVNWDDSNLKDLNENLSEALKTVKEIKAESALHAGFTSLAGFITGSGGNTGEMAKYALDKATYDAAQKNVEEENFKIEQNRKEHSGQKSEADIDKINREADERISELAKAGIRQGAPIYRKLPGGWDSDEIIGYKQVQLNQSEIDAINKNRQQQIASIHYDDFAKGNEKDAKTQADINKRAEEKDRKDRARQSELAGEVARGKDLANEEATPEQRRKYFSDKATSLTGRANVDNDEVERQKLLNEAQAAKNEVSKIDKDSANQKKEAQSKYNEDAKRVTELTQTDAHLAGGDKVSRVIASHSREIGGGGRAVGGHVTDPHVMEMKKNTQEIEVLTKAMQNLARSFGLTGKTDT